MEQDSPEVPTLSFDAVDDGYDPLVDLEIDDEDLDESDGQQGPNTAVQAKMLYATRAADRPVAQRIDDLFTAFAQRRRVLLAILGFLDEPRRSDALEERVRELQQYDVSVYSGYNYSMLLEEAGAIKKVNEEGADFDDEAEQLPDIIEIDGIEFYKPTDGKQVFWRITTEGRAYLETDDPFDRLAGLIADDQQYQALYKRLLEFCDNEVGRTATELAQLIDNDPLVQNPRRYFSYFAKRLEDCSALYWSQKWHTSELGRKGLKLLFSQNDEPQSGEKTEQLTGGEEL